MSLTVGARVGPYEIVSLLGVGGPPSLKGACGRSFGEISPKPSWWSTR